MGSNNFRKGNGTDRSDFDKTDFPVSFSLDEIRTRARKEEYEETIRPLLNGKENEQQKTREAIENKSKQIIHDWFTEKKDLIENEIFKITKPYGRNYRQELEYKLPYLSMHYCLESNDYFNVEYSEWSIELKFYMMLYFGIIDEKEASYVRYISGNVRGAPKNRMSTMRLIILNYLHETCEGFHIDFDRDGKIRFRWRI